MKGRFEGKRVLVTGGTTGMGRAVAERFQREGARVIAAGLDVGRVEAQGSIPSGITERELDVRSTDSIAALAKELPQLDVLVNGAGIILRDGGEFQEAGFASVLDVNLTGTMRVCLALKDALQENGGAVVNVGSLFSHFGAAHAPAYAASKGGVIQLTKSLALAWAKEKVRVNAVVPGWIETPFTAAIRTRPERETEILGRTPLGRWGTPDEVAGPVLFLASSEAGFITGSTLAVDGGYSAQ